jgi:FkbM family methyltransferase
MNSIFQKIWRRTPYVVRTLLQETELRPVINRALNIRSSQDEYEVGVVQLIRQIVQRGWVCADLGAHRGIVTRVIAQAAAPDGRVVAFEAHPGNARQLHERMKFFRYGRLVHVENMAVFDGESDSLWLFPGRGRSSFEWNVVRFDLNNENPLPEMRVPATSLDAYFAPDAPLHFVKIDVEAAEGQVLRGMRRLLREACPILMVEFHNEDGWSGRTELFSAGYDLYTLQGKRLDPDNDRKRVYHCLAFPAETPTPWDQQETVAR